MNKKGFTLIELLAVIAILAVLLVFAVPRVIKIFQDSKEDAFKIEVMNIYDAGINERTSSVIGNKTLVSEYSSNGEKLSINAKKSIEYNLKFGTNPKEMKYFCVSNGELRVLIDYESDSNIITKDNIQNVIVENTSLRCSEYSEEETGEFLELESFKNSLVSAGNYHFMVIDSQNRMWTWGGNGNVTLGDNTQNPKYQPINIVVSDEEAQPLRFSNVEGGYLHSMAIDTNGDLWVWGMNTSKSFALNTPVFSKVPIRTNIGSKYKEISAGWGHSMAIDINDQLWTWGYNSDGQVGNNSTDNTYVPYLISPNSNSTNFALISAGELHSMAIDKNNYLWIWGDNEYGQLGNNNIGTDSRVPVQLITSNGIKKFLRVSAGSKHSMAIDKDKHLWVWGDNSSSQLSNAVEGTNSSIPIQISVSNGNINEFIAIAGGLGHSLAIDKNKHLWAWGDNSAGQLGNGNLGSASNVPIQITASNGNITEFVAVYAGEYSSLAVDTTGKVWAWGRNATNRTDIEEGETVNTDVPVLFNLTVDID